MEETSHIAIQGQMFQQKEQLVQKPEGGACVVNSRTSREATVAGAE